MEYTIYRIYCKDENIKECYIGSTKNLDDRIRRHINNCYNPKYNLRVYNFIKENGGFSNWDFMEIEKTDKENRYIRERFWIENSNNLNGQIPTRTITEWYDKNKNRIKDLRSVKILCDCGCLISKRNYSQHLKTLKHINL
jgi:hypothetical protein